VRYWLWRRDELDFIWIGFSFVLLRTFFTYFLVILLDVWSASCSISYYYSEEVCSIACCLVHLSNVVS